MIIVPIKDGDTLDRALKRFKRKFDKVGIGREIRARKQYEKPSVKHRLKVKHAIYVQQLRRAEEQ